MEKAKQVEVLLRNGTKEIYEQWPEVTNSGAVIVHNVIVLYEDHGIKIPGTEKDSFFPYYSIDKLLIEHLPTM